MVISEESIGRAIHTALESTLVSDDYARLRRQYRIEKAVQIYKGFKHLAPKFRDGRLYCEPVRVSRDGTPGSLLASVSQDPTINVYQGDVRKLVAVLGQKPPNVNARAIDGTRREHLDRAKLADQVIQALYTSWKIGALHESLIYKLAVHGTCFLYTPWVTDAAAYGESTMPIFENRVVDVFGAAALCEQCGFSQEGESTVCPECGSPMAGIPASSVSIPEQVGEQSYANGGVECFILSGIDVDLPDGVKEFSDASWVRYETEESRGAVIAAYPHLRPYLQYGRSQGAADWESDARRRSRSASPLYTSQENLVTVRRQWVRRTEYAALPNHSLDFQGRRVEIAEWLQTSFPSGALFVSVGGRVAGVYDEDVDDVLTPVQPEAYDGVFAPGYMQGMVRTQLDVNDAVDIAHLCGLHSIPTTIIAPNILSEKTVENLGSHPGKVVQAVPGTYGRFGDGFYSLRTSEPRPEIFAHSQSMLALGREVSGVRPEIFGAGSSVTLGEAEMNRNQALMVLQSMWSNASRGWAQAFRKAVRLVALKSPENCVCIRGVGGASQRDKIEVSGDLQDLLTGGWSVHPDEAIPMGSAQFRTWIERVFMSGNPDLLGQLGLLHPDNARQMQDVLGLGSWVLPANKQREVVEGVIDRLLQSGPIESVDPMTGQPTLLPSEPFDDVLMDPQATVSIAREWALSEDGSRMRNENPDGFENVRVYIQSILSLMAGPPQGLMQGGGMGEGLVGEEAVEDPLAQAQLQ